MKKVQFRISNNGTQNIEMSLEPEGTIFLLSKGTSILVDITDQNNPAFDLQINKDSDGFYLSLWPDKGSFEIIEEYK